jgi:CubicO group peptidase (beta-lactamase class C family)
MKTPIILFLSLTISGTVLSQNVEKRLDSLFRKHVDTGEIHGCLVQVVQDKKPLLFKPYGMMDVENKRPVEKDAIFRLASMTKPLTAATALRLYDEGKFLLDDPVKKYIPEFANLKVISPDYKGEGAMITVPLERDVTVRDLFRHTAGFGYGGDEPIGKLYSKMYYDNRHLTLKEFVTGLTQIPLYYQPGEKWVYSFANDVLGYFIEVVSGKPLDEAMEELLFRPLGMNSTGFMVPAEKLNKLCNFYNSYEGKLELFDKAETSKLANRPDFISGGGGAVSTMEDYAKFCQMLLDHGKYKGKQILSPVSVELMVSNQIGEISNRGFEVEGYGLGIGVIPGTNNGKTRRCYWSGSPYNTTFIVDFDKNLYAIMLIQNGPWTHLGLMEKFRQIVVEEVESLN